MIRAGIVVAFGAGALVVPQVWWLFLAGFAVASVIAWPPRRRRVISLSRDLGESPAHYHYCPTCDQQWRHDAARCIAHWATRCASCGESRGEPAPLPRSA
jgi:hypothetical protein